MPLSRLTMKLLIIVAAAALAGAPAPAQVKKADVPGITNFSRVDATVGCGGATQPSAMAVLKKDGFVSVINLRLATEKGADIDAGRAAAKAAGLKYIHLPFDSADPDPQLVDKLLAAVGDKANQPVYIHCASANRVGVLWMIKRVLKDGWEIDKARKEAEAIGLSGPRSYHFAVNYIMSHQPSKAPTEKDRGFGDVHMDVSILPALSADFDAALALLHNFWYARALEAFNKLIKADPECAMAYWGAAMTYNHPFWDPPTKEDLTAAWALVQKGSKATKMNPREKMYLDAVAELYKDAGVGLSKAERDEAYLAAMKATVDKYPDDETKLFYGQMLLSTMPEGMVDDDIQPVVANILEEIYARKPMHPGVLHYLTHVYDDPVNAKKGLVAARAYAKSAMAVPHAHHMPSHIFTRLGLWEESAAANENAWRISEADVMKAGEHGGHRDFHALNYLQHAYLQMGRYRDAKRLTEIYKTEYDGLMNKQTAPDTPLLQAKHVKGRTIFGLPDRVVYGYSDTLARYLIETGDWRSFSKIPLVASSRDFVAMKTQLEAAAAARRGDAAAARAAADKLVRLSNEPGQHPFVQQIIRIQAKEAEAFAAHAAGAEEAVIEKMNEATAIEDSIFALSQPSYPAIPAHELFGTMLMEMKRPADAMKHFTETLRRTPGRPKAIYGIARAAEALGDKQTATKRYTEFLELWKNADKNLPEIATARRFLGMKAAPVDDEKVGNQGTRSAEWVNRKDRSGRNVFEGGFLGLDNIGVFDRSAPLPTGGHLEQADGTAWMALFSQNMMEMAAELAMTDPSYAEMTLKFAEHSLWIASAMDSLGDGTGMWDEEDGFFYDVLRLPNGQAERLKVRSMVGLLPLCAATLFEAEQCDKHPAIQERFRWFLDARPELCRSIHDPREIGLAGRRLSSILNETRLRRVLAKMLGENEFLSPYGLRSVSRYHADHPYVVSAGGQVHRVSYLPAESDTAMFGGNSNWRGPIWMPVNALIIRALLQYYSFYGNEFTVECPTGSGRQMNLFEVAEEIARRLTSIFLRDNDGRRPVYGGTRKFQEDPHWRDCLSFHEYFHGDNGAGLGASHQTGWTGVIARLMRPFAVFTPDTALEAGKKAKAKRITPAKAAAPARSG